MCHRSKFSFCHRLYKEYHLVSIFISGCLTDYSDWGVPTWNMGGCEDEESQDQGECDDDDEDTEDTSTSSSSTESEDDDKD